MLINMARWRRGVGGFKADIANAMVGFRVGSARQRQAREVARVAERSHAAGLICLSSNGEVGATKLTRRIPSGGLK